MKRLYRSRRDAMLGGVCGGIAEYFNIDSVIVRLAFALFGLAGGTGVLLYFICWVVIPERPRGSEDSVEDGPDRKQMNLGDDKVKLIIGFVFIGLGVMAFIHQIFPWFSFDFFWPAILIVIGALILMKGKVD